MVRAIFLSLFLIVTFVTFNSHVSYSANFSYDIDWFYLEDGEFDTFYDEFDDGAEPPSGPSGPSTYNTVAPFSSNRESGEVLNLNGNDAEPLSEDERDIGAILNDSTYFFVPGSGGSVEGKFSFTNGFETNSGFDIAILTMGTDTASMGTDTASFEGVWVNVEKSPSGRVIADFDAVLVGTDTSVMETDISRADITDSLNGITDLILTMEISAANVVTASLDFDSDGTFDLTMPGSYTLTFLPGKNYTGAFEAWKGNCLKCDLTVNPDGSVDLFVKNDCGEAVATEVKMWAELSGNVIPIINVGSDGSIVLPGGFQTTARIIQPTTLPDNLILGLRFLDPVTGEEQCLSKVETVFSENFNDGVADNYVDDGTGRWSVNSSGPISYAMTGNGAGNEAVSYYNQNFTDFAYSAYINKVSGAVFNVMGISFRGTDMFTFGKKNGYDFQISTSGNYRLVNVRPSSERVLIPWTSSPAINTGFNVWNNLKVVVQGTKIRLFINDTFVNSYFDNTHTSGKPYLHAFDGSGSTNVRFENVTLTRILK